MRTMLYSSLPPYRFSKSPTRGNVPVSENQSTEESKTCLTKERRGFLWGVLLTVVAMLVVFQFIGFRSDIKELRQELDNTTKKIITKQDVKDQLKPYCTNIKNFENQVKQQSEKIKELEGKVKQLSQKNSQQQPPSIRPEA
jgi:septal ring factor EnvC (AmiA/AmiB activator)